MHFTIKKDECRGLGGRFKIERKCVHPGLIHIVVWQKSTGHCKKIQFSLVQFVQSNSRVQIFATPQTIACQTHLSMEFSRQEYWSGLPFFLLGDLSDPGIKPTSPVSAALQVDSFTTAPPEKPHVYNTVLLTTVTMLYITSSEIIHTLTESLYPLTNLSHPSDLANHHSIPCFYEFDIFRFHI